MIWQSQEWHDGCIQADIASHSGASCTLRLFFKSESVGAMISKESTDLFAILLMFIILYYDSRLLELMNPVKLDQER